MHRGVVAYTLRLGVLATCVLAACACGPSAKPLSGEYTLSPNTRYVTDKFEPAFTLEVGKGWELEDGRQQKPFFVLSWEYQGGDRFVGISFNNPPSRVSDPTNPDKLVSTPKDWVSWFRGHPHLEVSKPLPTSVGGVRGRRFDYTVSALPEDYHSEHCYEMEVPLWPLPIGHHWCAIDEDGYTQQTIVLDNIEGETVIIDVWSYPEEASEKVLPPEAKEVLDSVEWEGA
jgi:hypothetical protein